MRVRWLRYWRMRRMAKVPQGLDPLQDVQEPVKLSMVYSSPPSASEKWVKNPLGVEAGQFHCSAPLGAACSMVSPHGRGKIQAGHAGVTLNMDGQGASCLLYLGREGLGVVQVVAGLGM